MSSAFSSRLSSSNNRSVRPGASKPASKTQPKSFSALASRVLNSLYTGLLSLYRKLRSLLWIGSTAFIFLMVPVMYSKLVETEIEFMKLERASDIAAGRAPIGGAGAGPLRGSF